MFTRLLPFLSGRMQGYAQMRMLSFEYKKDFTNGVLFIFQLKQYCHFQLRVIPAKNFIKTHKVSGVFLMVCIRSKHNN